MAWLGCVGLWFFLERSTAAGLKEGLKEGLRKGEEIGLQKSTQAMAMAMKALGLPLADIAKITGLSASEVEKLPAEKRA